MWPLVSIARAYIRKLGPLARSALQAVTVGCWAGCALAVGKAARARSDSAYHGTLAARRVALWQSARRSCLIPIGVYSLRRCLGNVLVLFPLNGVTQVWVQALER